LFVPAFRLQRFEKTNEMLSNCNSLSATRLERARRDFRGHSQLLMDLKKDLDAIFRRIRTLKTKVAQQNPEAFQGRLF
jgi:chromosome segregation ATPase